MYFKDGTTQTVQNGVMMGLFVKNVLWELILMCNKKNVLQSVINVKLGTKQMESVLPVTTDMEMLKEMEMLLMELVQYGMELNLLTNTMWIVNAFQMIKYVSNAIKAITSVKIVNAHQTLSVVNYSRTTHAHNV